MSVRMVVCAKQVIDPETPLTAFKVDRESKRALAAGGADPVVNGFDEVAMEAALRIKESVGGSIRVISMGRSFVTDVITKPLAMGGDELFLLQGEGFDSADSFTVATVLAGAIGKLGGFDLILCGRQASDWDNGQVPLGLAELLGVACLTIAKKVEVREGMVRVERVMSDGYEVVEAALPAVVTVTNELGEPRIPTIKGLMEAGRKKPTVWGASELGVEISGLGKSELSDLFIPERQKRCELVEGEDETEAGRKLALKLREAKLI